MISLSQQVQITFYDSNGNTVASYVATSQPTVYAEDGTFYFNTTVKIRTAPNLSSSTDTGLCYYSGESVIYHTVYLNKNGYNWIQYTRSNGTQGYCII